MLRTLSFNYNKIFRYNKIIRNMSSKNPYYLDMQATTPMDPRVLTAMMPYFTEKFGNVHSKTHKYGWDAEEGVENARKQVADLIGANLKDIVFTSGATESNNIAIKGVANFHKKKKNHIITTQTEHKCVLESCRYLQQNDFEVTYLPVQTNGIINLEDLNNAINEKTVLVSIMAVNNEIGVIQPLKEIGQLCRKKKIYFHTDAAQAIGKIPIDVDDMNIDLMSISGHKFYGPKGIGALYVRRRPRVRIESIISGGGQERGIRSGTLASPLIIGIGEASKIAGEEMEKDKQHITYLRDKLFNGVMSKLSHVTINGCPDNRYSGNMNLSFAGVEGESLLMSAKQLAISSGSACTSASLEPSYVLRALGVGDELAHSSIRFGIGRFTTEDEIDKSIEIIINSVNNLRDISPLWEMMQDGIDLSTIKWNQH